MNEHQVCNFDCENSYAGAPREMNACFLQCEDAYARCLDENSKK